MAGKAIKDYKSAISNKLIEDENLLKALVNNSSDFLSVPLPISPEESFYDYIYPYRKVDGILTDTKSYITMDFKGFKPNSANYLYSGYVNFYILCHESLVRTDYGQQRYDYIVDRIRNLFDHNKEIVGFGECIVTLIDDITSEDGKYFGSLCQIKINDIKTGLSND